MKKNYDEYQNRENVNYRVDEDDNLIHSFNYYDCGCSWEIVWKNIRKGEVKQIYNNLFCQEHDPTITTAELLELEQEDDEIVEEMEEQWEEVEEYNPDEDDDFLLGRVDPADEW